MTLADKRFQAPAISIACTEACIEGLDQQEFEDWSIAGPAWENLIERPGRYFLIVLENAAFREALGNDHRLLSRLIFEAETQKAALTSVYDDDGYVFAALLFAPVLLDHPFISRIGSVFESVFRHVLNIGGRAQRLVVPGGMPLQHMITEPIGEPRDAAGYFAPPFPPLDVQTLRRLSALMKEPYTLPGAPKTCSSNDFYGHAEILRKYCRVRNGLPIRGRVQHGWTPVGAGFSMDDDHAGPFYVWSERIALEYEALSGHPGEVIGAPYLYLPEYPDPGPAVRRLLAFPHHSIRASRVEGDWGAYARGLLGEARRLDLKDGAVCALNSVDYAAHSIEVEAEGVVPICTGYGADSSILYKIRDLIRQHSVITSNRVCTAAFYALYEGRRFVLFGDPMRSEPPDKCETEALGWGLLAQNGLAGRSLTKDAASLELGAAYKRSPDELREMLFGWL